MMPARDDSVKTAAVPRREIFWPAAGVAAWTGFLFLAVYRSCNWITAQRPDVGVAVFDWERHIPVIPWMIVPYWSLDLFFVAAPFLCGDRGELRTLRRRLEVATLAAGVCFLIIPLTLAWERPAVIGVFAPLFQAIQGFDAPHNLFPSLHITYRTLLAAHYARHSTGAVRVASHIWFSLVGFSTLFTRQHHFADIAGGFLLAAVCFRLSSSREMSAPGKNVRVGVLYLVGALVCLVCARLALPWSLALAWPAASLGLAAAASLGGGAAVIGKTNGRIPLVSRVLLAPWLLGQWLSWRHYRKASHPWDEVCPGLWVGALPDRETALRAKEAGVTHVLDLTAEFDTNDVFRSVAGYLSIPVQDLTAPTADQLESALLHLDAAARGGGIAFVHCKAGYSRSAAVAGAWMMRRGHASSAAHAMDLLRERRPGMIIRPEVADMLRQLETAAH